MARRLQFDRLLFATVLLLTGLGLVMVYSSTAVMAQERGLSVNSYFIKQCFAALLGFVAMLVLMHVDYRHFERRSLVYALLLGVVGLLSAVLFLPDLNNARRWFVVGGLSVQPSELAKLAVVVYVAYQIERKAERLASWSFLLPSAFVTALLIALILAGRDLGTMVLLAIPPFLMMFLAGLKLRPLLVGGALLLPVIAWAVAAEPYRFRRWTIFLDPESDRLGYGFQPLQSLIAVGSGGLFGLGPGSSMQKLHFLPSPHADFVFSIAAEELGFLGALAVVALFAVYLWRGVLAGLSAPDLFGRYLAWGLTFLVVSQALIHISVALSILPTTGVPLPFISHGGSSLLVTLAASGLVLNVSQWIK